MKLMLIIAVLAVVIVFTPLAVIWALNTLFSLAIAYSFWNWVAVVVLMSVFSGAASNVKG